MTRAMCQETQRWSKAPVLTMVIYGRRDHSQHVSEPFNLLESVLHEAHLHLDQHVVMNALTGLVRLLQLMDILKMQFQRCFGS